MNERTRAIIMGGHVCIDERRQTVTEVIIEHGDGIELYDAYFTHGGHFVFKMYYCKEAK